MGKEEFVKIVSTGMDRIKYNSETNTLTVVFKNGKVYQYLNIPKHHYDKMLCPGVSVGRYFYYNIRDNYPCVEAESIEKKSEEENGT